jgi:hypothetical protein
MNLQNRLIYGEGQVNVNRTPTMRDQIFKGSSRFLTNQRRSIEAEVDGFEQSRLSSFILTLDQDTASARKPELYLTQLLESTYIEMSQ